MARLDDSSVQARARIRAWLERVRSAAWTMLVTQRLGWMLACAVAAVIAGGVLDYFLRAPTWLRTIGLFGAIGVLAYFVRLLLLPALRFRPSLTEIALRVETTQPATELKGLLASGFELGGQQGDGADTRLAETVVRQAADRLEGIRPAKVYSPQPTMRALGVLACAAVVALGFAVQWPTLTSIGATRMLLPFAGAEWPKRTQIADATLVEHHPLGSALELKALLVRSEYAPDATRIVAKYRVITDGTAGQTRSAALNRQNVSSAVMTPGGAPVEGMVFDRLIEPAGLTPGGRGGAGTPGALAKVELQYWFESFDDQTSPRTIVLVDPPTIVKAGAEIRTPAYAAKVLGQHGSEGSAGVSSVDLGAGTDDRAAPPPILAGSRVRMTIEFNKPLSLPRTFDPTTPEGREFVERSLGPEAAALFAPAEGQPPSGATLSADGRTWTLEWQHWDTLRVNVQPEDEYRIASAEEAVFRFEAIKDSPPTATVTLPLEDKSVLPTALVEITGEGRDDVAMEWVALERQLARRNPTSEGGAAEGVGDRVEMARAKAETAGEAPAEPGVDPVAAPAAAAKRVSVGVSLDLSSIADLKPGDELWITALAMDAFELDGRRHEPVRSSVRKLRILSREQLVEQIWSELGTLRRTAIKIDQDQEEVSKNAPQPGPAGEDASRRGERAQSGLTERLARQNQTIKQLQERVRENALSDAVVNDVLREAGETLQRAGEKSSAASRSMSQAAQEQSQQGAPESAGKEPLEQASKNQEGVRDDLADLIDMLDQGEDTFASKRSLERLIEQQKQLQQKTLDAGRSSAGKTTDQLSDQEKQALQDISDQQNALSDQLRDAVKKMQERQDKLSKSDPAAAQAMQQAARRSQRDQTPEKMQQAAQQARQNQTSSASQQQQQALDSMQQMLQDMNQAQANKDEVLRRVLASLIESIEGLIQQQTAQLDALKAAQGDAQIKALEQPMIQLYQNTLGVMEEAANAPREVTGVAEELEKAGDAMAGAIPELREAKAQTATARETEALDHLKLALEAAKKQDQKAQDRQNARKRAELRGRYEEALQRQVGLRDAAQGLVGAEATRRNRNSSRQIGDDQSTLKSDVAAIQTETKELASAQVFVFAHKRLDDLMTEAAANLGGGLPDDSTIRTQTSAARLLKSLAEALDDRKKDDDPFRKPEDAGGGGGGGSQEPPVVPPAAEIVLLKLMQQEALEMSRGAAEAKAPDAKLVESAASLQRDLSTQGAELLKKLAEKEPVAPKAKPADAPAKEDNPGPPAPEEPKKEGGAE